MVLEKELRALYPDQWAGGEGGGAGWLGEPLGVILIQITMPSDLFSEQFKISSSVKKKILFKTRNSLFRYGDERGG